MFQVSCRSSLSRARRGILSTPHGDLATPFFMPIATKGAVKTLSSEDVARLGSPILLANTYHLWLRPGLEVLSAFGGLHRFMGYEGAILTDSGGFQVFSLDGLRRLTDEGVEFQSHLDGVKLMLSPELCVDIQRAIGSDIVMALDVCTRLPALQEDLTRACALTTAWARRSKERFLKTRADAINPEAKIFGIVQGGTDLALRTQSAREIMEIGFDGYAVGGLSVGEPFPDACRTLEMLDDLLPADTPRYFMGGAEPDQIVEYVKRGMDMFDCVLPTRNARHGKIYRFTHGDVARPDFYETVQITNEKWKFLKEEICGVTLGYLRHLFTVQEMLGYRLATLANLTFYLELMQKIREAIEQKRL